MNTKETKIGNIILNENYFIFQPDATSMVDTNNSRELKVILEKEFNNHKFCCIVDNKNNPSFDYLAFITILKEMFVPSQLSGLARINYGYDIKSLLQLKNLTNKHIKYDEFNNMDEAIAWVGNILK